MPAPKSCTLIGWKARFPVVQFSVTAPKPTSDSAAQSQRRRIRDRTAMIATEKLNRTIRIATTANAPYVPGLSENVNAFAVSNDWCMKRAETPSTRKETVQVVRHPVPLGSSTTATFPRTQAVSARSWYVTLVCTTGSALFTLIPTTSAESILAVFKTDAILRNSGRADAFCSDGTR